MKIYDLIILGAGPAGITASVYAARKKLEFLVITKDIGGQTAISGDIENYTGYQFVKGPELTDKFKEHMDSFGISVNMPESVREIRQEDNSIRVVTDNAEYLSKSLIIATGASPRLLEIEGEQEFKNKGVTYCTTCDGPLFKNKNVTIIGGGNSAIEAALQMIKISPKVYIINIAHQLSADPVSIEKIESAPNAEIFNSSNVKKIYGEALVKGLQIEKDNKVFDLAVEGVFVEIGLRPNSNFSHPLKLNEKKEIEIDSYNRTNMQGIFAAGDVSSVLGKQIIIACGEGAKALASVFTYLSTHKF